MGRIRVLSIFALFLGAVISQASDYRLVIASDDPAIRKAPSMVVFEGNGKLTPEDRITSITFSAEAIEPNCLVSLDPASGKASLALGPDVEVFQGKLLIAGSKPTKKVIPAHIAVDVPAATGVKDGKLNGMMQPIIQQVNNLPWPFIVLAVGVVIGFIFVMNRRSQQYTTSMSKEAKNLYLETVGRITERLERIETTQERLVKNPPVVRTFKAQIEEFESKLGRIEKLAKDTKEEVGRASIELSQGDKRHDDLVGRIDSTKSEATKTQTTLKQEADALRAEMKLLLKGQDEATAKLSALDDLKSSDQKILDQGKSIESALAAQEAEILKAQAEHLQHLQQLQGELATMRTNQEALSAMPKELELVNASLANFPAEFESVRNAMPRLDGIETKLDSFSDFGPKLDHISGFGEKLDHISGFGDKLDYVSSFDTKLDKMDRFDEISDKLNALPEIQNSLNALPTEFPKNDEELSRVHESLLLEIESLSGKVDESSANLSEQIAAHQLSTHAPASVEEVVAEAEVEEAPVETKKSRRGKHIQPVAEEVEVIEAMEEVVEEPSSEAPPFEPEMELPQTLEMEVEADLGSPEPEVEATFEPEAAIEEAHEELVDESAIKEIEEPVAGIAPEPVFEEQIEEPQFEVIEEESMIAEVQEIEEPMVMEVGHVFEVGAEEPTAEVEMFDEQTSEEVILDSMEPEVFEPEIEVETLDQVQMVEEEPVSDEALGAIEPEMTLETETESIQEEEPIAEEKPEPEFKATEVNYRYAEPETPSIPEFNFTNAIKKMTEDNVALALKDENQKAGQEAPISFKLEALPDHLETFEDAGADAVLQTMHVENSEQYFEEDNGNAAAELVLKNLAQVKTATEDVADFDSEPEEEGNTHVGHWSGAGGSSSRTWGSESSRPLELVRFEGELKPLTPIETAPPGDTVGAMVYGMGRVAYACGKNVYGFWPGKDDRHVPLDFPVSTEDWRLALKGQNLFVVEEKKVKILSIQSWFVLEQFKGEYHDQLLTGNRWAGLRNDNGPVIDFRDMRGQVAAEGIRLDMEWDGLKLASSEDRMYAGSCDGRFFEVSEFGTELLGSGPENSELVHLSSYDNGIVALLRVGDNLECLRLDGESRSISLDMRSFAGNPILLGTKLYLADLENSKLVTLNLKKMSVSKVDAFDGVSDIRRMVGVQHKSQHDLFLITTDTGKKGGRLVMLDAKSGAETTFGSVGQATVNLIAADHHVVLSTSSQYQNVIRVLEPFAQRVAA